jgi:hypothetical protein
VNVSSRIQVWEQQNNDSGLGTREQRLRTGNNRTRAQDWEQQNMGLGLGTTEEGLRTGKNTERRWRGGERSSGFGAGRELVHAEEEDGVHLNTKKNLIKNETLVSFSHMLFVQTSECNVNHCQWHWHHTSYKTRELSLSQKNRIKNALDPVTTCVADPHHFDADPDLDPTSPHSLFQDLDPPMLQNDPLRLPLFHIDADQDPDPAFHIVAEPDPAFHFDEDPDPASKMMRIH